MPTVSQVSANTLPCSRARNTANHCTNYDTQGRIQHAYGWPWYMESKLHQRPRENEMCKTLSWHGHPFCFIGSLYWHYDDVIMSMIASQITSLTIVYSTVYSDADQRKHQSSASLAFVWGIHRGPVNSPHKWPVTRKMSPFDDVIMGIQLLSVVSYHKEPVM